MTFDEVTCLVWAMVAVGLLSFAFIGRGRIGDLVVSAIQIVFNGALMALCWYLGYQVLSHYFAVFLGIFIGLLLFTYVSQGKEAGNG